MKTDIRRKSVIVCLCLLAGTLVWCLWPEYGSGYSEQQRRLWNERRTLYPVAWVLDEVDPDQRITSPPYADISNLTGESGESIGQFVKEKSARDKELKQRLEKNRDSSGVEYGEVEFSRADVSRLPLQLVSRGRPWLSIMRISPEGMQKKHTIRYSSPALIMERRRIAVTCWGNFMNME